MALPAVFTRPAMPPDRVIRYGGHPDQVVDVRSAPDAPHAPVVVLLHGGFWRAEHDRLHTRPMADELARRGYVVCTPEYRRVGRPGGGHPGTFDDVAAAVDTIAREFRGRIALVGHSAGGHLALWAAMRDRLPVTSPWHARTGMGVVALAAVSDLGAAVDAGLGGGAALDLLGGRPGLLAETDPMRLLPYGGGPLVLVHGTEDSIVPVEMSRRFAKECSARLVEIDGGGHFGLIDPLSPAWPAVRDAIGSVLPL